MLGIKERVRSVGTRGGWHWNGVLEVTFPNWGVRGDSAWPLVSPEQQLSARGYGVNAGWVLMLVLVFFSFSCLPLPMAAVWTSPCLAAAWIPSPQNVSPRWVNIVLFLRARGVVVSPVLVPLPSVPLWPGFQRTPGWAFLCLPAQGRLHFPCPIPVILQGVCALPHSPLSLTPAVWGGEPLPSFASALG